MGVAEVTIALRWVFPHPDHAARVEWAVEEAILDEADRIKTRRLG